MARRPISPRQPEQVRAYRDTWHDGIHSYLSYLRDRLVAARDLLTPSGSVFVQIGDENVHRVRAVMDEVFGPDNFVSMITFAKTSGSSSDTLPSVADYLIWYAKFKKIGDRVNVKFRRLYEELTRREVIEYFSWHAFVELPNGHTRKLTENERFAPDKYLLKDAKLWHRKCADSQGVSHTGLSEPFNYQGRVFRCGHERHWSVPHAGLERAVKAGRLGALENQYSLMIKSYEDEVPGRRINNIWRKQMFSTYRSYIVETAAEVIKRYLLMTTDPGDLVLDPTCGSGTTAFVAEQWGRRWITVDTSRVALTLARARIMAARYPYYLLADSNDGRQRAASKGCGTK